MDGHKDDVIGFACPMDGTGCKPLTREVGEALWQQAKASEEKRAKDMPTEQDALQAMFSAYQRLRELGWKEAMYCPKDGSVFDAIEVGSTGIHECIYQGEWPDGCWWSYDGEMWPMSPCLYRLKINQIEGEKP